LEEALVERATVVVDVVYDSVIHLVFLDPVKVHVPDQAVVILLEPALRFVVEGKVRKQVAVLVHELVFLLYDVKLTL